MRRAFTLIEVLAILLVVSVGLVSVLGLTSYAMGRASLIQGATSGLATAESVALDATPLLAPEIAASWTYAPYAMGGTGASLTTTLQSSAKGFINGFYVVRTETSRPSDIIALGKDGAGTPTVYARSANVTVDVYDTIGGRSVACYTTRIIRQRGRQ